MKLQKKEAVRSLMNIRMPRYIDRKILKVQDDFLKKSDFGKGNCYIGYDSNSEGTVC